MSARLIVNADDFGLTVGVNRAVGELHEAGAITSATLMATGTAFRDAVRVAHEHPTLGVGCHVVFVDGVPISQSAQVPTLFGTDGKMRPSFGSFASAVFRGKVQEEQLVLEAVAQVQQLQRTGIQVTHLDTHKHTHMLPMVHRALLIAARRCGIGAIRLPFEPQWTQSLGHGGLLRRASIAFLAKAFRVRFHAQQSAAFPQIMTTDGTIGIGATGTLNMRTLGEMLTAMPAFGTWELVVHPGYNDAALAVAGTRLRSSRELERQALLGMIPTIKKIEHPPAMIHYGHL